MMFRLVSELGSSLGVGVGLGSRWGQNKVRVAKMDLEDIGIVGVSKTDYKSSNTFPDDIWIKRQVQLPKHPQQNIEKSEFVF